MNIVTETKPLWPEDYDVHPDHCRDVVEGGAYDIPWSPETPPVVLDLGANVGGFCRFASARWPGCTIYAYEPHPNNFKLLKRTVDAIPDNSRIQCSECAVADAASTMKLKFHATAVNCGEWSLNTGGEPKDSVDVAVIDARTLPKADILKIDTEGSEAQILEALKYRLHEFSAVMMEIHSASWVAPITDILRIAGFSVIAREVKFNSENRVELKMLKTNLLPKS